MYKYVNRLTRLLYARCSTSVTMLLWRGFNDFEVNRRALAGCLSVLSAGSTQHRKCQLMHLHFSLVCQGAVISIWACCLQFTKDNWNIENSRHLNATHFTPIYRQPAFLAILRKKHSPQCKIPVRFHLKVLLLLIPAHPPSLALSLNMISSFLKPSGSQAKEAIWQRWEMSARAVKIFHSVTTAA